MSTKTGEKIIKSARLRQTILSQALTRIGGSAQHEKRRKKRNLPASASVGSLQDLPHNAKIIAKSFALTQIFTITHRAACGQAGKTRIRQGVWSHGSYRAQLSFLRNVDKKEVDFLVTVDNRPWFCVEAKHQDQAISDHLGYFRDRLNIPYAFQVIRTPGIDLVRRGVRLISADRFLAALI